MHPGITNSLNFYYVKCSMNYVRHLLAVYGYTVLLPYVHNIIIAEYYYNCIKHVYPEHI